MADAEEKHEEHVDVDDVEEQHQQGFGVGPGPGAGEPKQLQAISDTGRHDPTAELREKTQ
eukprot:scaffold151383_cov50-Prasinocladus_malaysianus.AAC.1